MNAWYEAESELEALFGEGEGGFRPLRSFRAPTPRPFSTSRSLRPSRPSGGGMFRAAPARPGSWRQRRRRPWLIYGVRPYADGYGFPFSPLLSGLEPEPLTEPTPDEGGEEEVEYEAPRGPLAARIGKWEFRTFSRFPATNIPSGGGVYIVVQDKQLLKTGARPSKVLDVDRLQDMLPLYVGKTSNFQKRWRGRLVDLHEIGITEPSGQLPPYHPHIHVWFGPISGITSKELETVEHIIIRTLIRGGVVREINKTRPRLRDDLRNLSSFLPVHVMGALPGRQKVSIRIENLLPGVHWWKAKALRAPALQTRYDAKNNLTLGTERDFELLFG